MGPPQAAGSHSITLGAEGSLSVEVFMPPDGASGGGVVLGAEAMGPNRFARGVASRLAALGYVTMMPDYLRGAGPTDPDDYEDLEPVRECIARLDFRRATLDTLSAVDHIRGHPDVDADRVAVWGYCTGGTLALLAACLDRSLAAAVVFYPSQLVFDRLTDDRPVHPMDLLWAARCPMVVFFGDADPVLPPERREELTRRFETWPIEGRLVVYPGADHVFAGSMPGRYRAEYDGDSWRIATDLLDRALENAPADDATREE